MGEKRHDLLDPGEFDLWIEACLPSDSQSGEPSFAEGTDLTSSAEASSSSTHSTSWPPSPPQPIDDADHLACSFDATNSDEQHFLPVRSVFTPRTEVSTTPPHVNYPTSPLFFFCDQNTASLIRESDMRNSKAMLMLWV